MSYSRANPATSQTNTNIIPSISGMTVQITEWYCSSDTEMLVTLLNADAHTVLARLYVGARGGLVLPHSFMSAYGEGIDFTTSSNGNVYIAIEWNRRGKG